MEKKIFKKLFVEIGVVFLLTSLTLSLIIWILQAVNFLDIISEDGHSIATYFKYSLLNLPKIISKILLLSFFLSLFYVLVSYDEKNQLLIYWSNGISKNKFLSKIFFFSFLFIFFSFLLSFVIVPFTQDKARSFIRNSSLDFLSNDNGETAIGKGFKFPLVISTSIKALALIGKKNKQIKKNFKYFNINYPSNISLASKFNCNSFHLS